MASLQTPNALEINLQKLWKRRAMRSAFLEIARSSAFHSGDLALQILQNVELASRQDVPHELKQGRSQQEIS